MESAIPKGLNLLKYICQFQDGLPLELLEITRLAKSIVISPCFTLSSRCPKAYLSNIPLRFQCAPYLELSNYHDQLPNYVLFLSDHYEEPTLPLHLSILENNIKHVELWIKSKPEWLTPAPLKLAAICGHLEIVKSLTKASKSVWTPEAMDLAATNGYLDVVKFLHFLENGPGCTTAAMDGAATYGHLEVVKFLNENRSEGCTSEAMRGAIRKGYGGVVNYLVNHRNQEYIRGFLLFHHIHCYREARDKDYIGVLEYLISRPVVQIDQEIIFNAIEADPLPILEYLHQYNIHVNTRELFDKLIETRKNDAIRYALELILTENNKPISFLNCDDGAIELWSPQDIPMSPQVYSGFISELSCDWGSTWKRSKAMDIAAALGNLETIKLLHRSGIKCCTTDAMDKASAIGRIDITQWLHIHRTEGCTDDAITYAIAGRHFDMVQWLHNVKGLNCTMDGLSTAAYLGDVDMITYLISIPLIPAFGNPYDTPEKKSICMPGKDQTIEVYCGNAVDQAALNGHIEIVKILHQYPATTKAMDGAASNGHFEMVKYLHTHRNEGCTSKAYSSAIEIKRLDILNYLVENNCARTSDC